MNIQFNNLHCNIYIAYAISQTYLCHYAPSDSLSQVFDKVWRAIEFTAVAVDQTVLAVPQYIFSIQPELTIPSENTILRLTKVVITNKTRYCVLTISG